MRTKLDEILAELDIYARVEGTVEGPTVTRWRVRPLGATRVSKLQRAAPDIAIRLGVPAVRMLPGNGTVDFEIPSPKRSSVCFAALCADAASVAAGMRLPVYMGAKACGLPMVEDLARWPHALIAGTTGSGKSVALNTIVCSLLRLPVDRVRLVLIDPKQVEMAPYAGVRHLARPIITDPSEALGALIAGAALMDQRYAMLAQRGVRSLAGATDIPSIVYIIDELADLIMQHPEVETPIVRIAQKARAVGIHLVIATQRPSAQVVTGLIKANLPTRIAMKVASGIDSRMILDQTGAERLLGNGDMLIVRPTGPDAERAQGAFIDDAEVSTIARAASRGKAGPSIGLEGSDPVGERPEADPAAGWLLQRLGGTPKRADIVLSDAKRAGYTPRAIHALLGDLRFCQRVDRSGQTWFTRTDAKLWGLWRMLGRV